MTTAPLAVAVRAVTALSPTSTMSALAVGGEMREPRGFIPPPPPSRARGARASPRRRRPAASGFRRRGSRATPTAASRATSAGVKMPLSPTTSRSAGTSGARRSDVASVVSKVLRSRLLMPISGEARRSARSSSASSCTSTSTSMPSVERGVLQRLRLVVGDAAMMIRMQSAPQARASNTW